MENTIPTINISDALPTTASTLTQETSSRLLQVLAIVAGLISGLAATLALLWNSFFKPRFRAYVKKQAARTFAAAGVTLGKDLVVHDEGAYLRWAVDGSLGFGESYMAKAWDAGAGVPLHEVVRRMIQLPAQTKRRVLRPWNAGLVQVYNRVFNLQSMARAGIVAERHYDLGNDFYALWLDRNMQYTCAYWKGIEDPDDLEGAQLNKMRLIAEKLKLEPGMTVADLGNGFGTLDCYLAENYGVHVTGINISKEQVKYARDLAEKRGLGHKTNFLLDDYRNLSGEFDRVVTVGFVEHVGYKNLAGLYDLVARVLKPGGLALVQTITNGKTVSSQYAERWIHKYIFPNGYLPSPRLLLEHAEGKLVVEDAQNLGLDYEKTLRAWRARFARSAGLLEDGGGQGSRCSNSMLEDETFVRMWDYYFNYCIAGFQARIIHLYQVVYSKKRHERYDAPR